MPEQYTNIKRLHQIVRTLIRYGFGSIVAEMNVLPYSSILRKFFFFKRAGRGKSVPVRVRLMLEELGPTYIKLGQIASTRADALPPEWIEELKKLQDMVPPDSGTEIRKIVEHSLGSPISETFKSFNTSPEASASVAQVHYAELPDGTEVAIKVRRPRIKQTIESDISVMRQVALLMERYIPSLVRYRPLEVVNEFSRVIHRELDMKVEATNAEHFAKIFAGDKRIQIPRVYWNYTTEELLTMDRLNGVPIDETELIKEKGLDIQKIAVSGLEIFFKQVFEFGIFHADLHPGNIFVRDDGVIIYLDFGIVGKLDRNIRRYLASMLFHLIKEDYHRLAKLHRQMGLIGRHVDLAEFEEALSDIGEPIHGRDLEQINVSALLMKLLDTARRFDMVLQPNLLLLQKSMVIIEGVGRQLYPDINVWEVAKPLIYRWMIKEKISPKEFFKKSNENIRDMAGDLLGLPAQASEFLDLALNEELHVQLTHPGIDDIAKNIDRLGRRINRGIIIGALVLGASLIAVFAPEKTTRILGIPVISWAGYAIAAVEAIYSTSSR
jgi:ubiquinone biosynthesis protein